MQGLLSTSHNACLHLRRIKCVHVTETRQRKGRRSGESLTGHRSSPLEYYSTVVLSFSLSHYLSFFSFSLLFSSRLEQQQRPLVALAQLAHWRNWLSFSLAFLFAVNTVLHFQCSLHNLPCLFDVAFLRRSSFAVSLPVDRRDCLTAVGSGSVSNSTNFDQRHSANM